MFKKNPVRFVGAWLAILLVLGLIDYAHLHAGSSHPRASSAAHVALGRAPAASGTSTTRTSNSVPPKASSSSAATTPVTGHKGPAQPTAPAHPASPATPAAPAHPAPAPSAASGPTHAATPAPPAARQSPATTVTYVVQPGDTLWGLAAAHLGNPYRWTELFAINRGRQEPGGQVLANPNLIVTGWTLEFPAGSRGFPTEGTTDGSTLGSIHTGMQIPSVLTSLAPFNGARSPTGSLQ
jgi:LysM repeat protein